MRLYRLLDRIFPNSFAAKLYFVAFLGTHLPLVAVVSWVTSGQRGLPLWSFEVALILAATLAGTLVTLVCIWSLLAPLRRIERDLKRFESEGILPRNENTSADDVGRLSRAAGSAAQALAMRLAVAKDEAQVDELTSTLNRRGFFDLVESAAPGEAALLFLDLDNFKALNDTQGHLAGDRMLIKTADAMRRVTRDGDLVARMGGDEFIVVLPNAEPDHAADIARRIREEVTRASMAMNADITASIGVTFRDPEENWPDTVDRADHAMLSAKTSGRNTSRMAIQ